MTDKPSLIEIKTTIGWGSQNEGTEKVHGAPLSADDIKQLKEKLGLNPNEDFHVPEDTRKVRGSLGFVGKQCHTLVLGAAVRGATVDSGGTVSCLHSCKHCL